MAKKTETLWQTFSTGYKDWRIEYCETEGDYVDACLKAGVTVEPDSSKEKACTVWDDGMIYINVARHHTAADIIHSFLHEMLHVVWYAWGQHTSAHHNEIEIDGKAAIMTQIYLTAK